MQTTRDVTYLEVSVHVELHKIVSLVDGMVERIIGNGIIVGVSQVNARNTSNSDEGGKVTSSTNFMYSTHVQITSRSI